MFFYAIKEFKKKDIRETEKEYKFIKTIDKTKFLNDKLNNLNQFVKLL